MATTVEAVFSKYLRWLFVARRHLNKAVKGPSMAKFVSLTLLFLIKIQPNIRRRRLCLAYGNTTAVVVPIYLIMHQEQFLWPQLAPKITSHFGF